jgi:hypothetical protein
MPIMAATLVEVTPPHVQLLPVKDRGVQFDPPSNYTTPYQAGTAALKILGEILAEAEHLVS